MTPKETKATFAIMKLDSIIGGLWADRTGISRPPAPFTPMSTRQRTGAKVSSSITGRLS